MLIVDQNAAMVPDPQAKTTSCWSFPMILGSIVPSVNYEYSSRNKSLNNLIYTQHKSNYLRYNRHTLRTSIIC